ncbi:hypothetical protein EJ110_NYTH32894 [Nymphaea thermarum]|nr:hypothetical protein EJ110_NYTH32894 [Nymphaea thermarum]
MSTLQISAHFPATRGRVPLTKKTSRYGAQFLPFLSRTTRGCVFVDTHHGNWSFSRGRWSPFHGGGLPKRTGLIVVRVNRGFGFNGGGGGGGNENTRIVGNLILAIALTYLTMTGQLGWLLDAIVSLWIVVVLLPVAGIGAFLWFAGRDILQGSCPNCGNDLQIFKSSLKDGPQLCPYCSQPFSVQDDQFVRETVKFSNDSRPRDFGQVFNGFRSRGSSEKVSSGKTSSSGTVVDIEAEIKDVD